MNSKLKVSIITVVFNNKQTVRDAIDSVLNLSYDNIEYIVIDGGSTDGTVEVIESYGNRIDKFISGPDKGIYDAMNKGVRNATGDVIGILNSDDLYPDTTVLSDVMSWFNSDPDLDVLYGDLVYVRVNNTDKIIRKWRSGKYYDNFFENANVPPHPALFLRAQVYRQAGLFDLQYKLAADYEFMFRIFKKFKFKSVYIKRLVVKMRLGGATNKNLKNIINGNKEILEAWKNNGFTPPITFMPLKIMKRFIQFVNK